MEKELQGQFDAIDKLSDVEVRIMLRETYITMHRLSASWEESKAKLENECKGPLKRYKSLQKDFTDYKSRLRSMFEL
jgi:hypothetical protein